ncbi:MAG: class I SAM-dependent methyltransferase [Patescibacteria group bacterium]|nr:methyltransferase domain-containing protein [Patescibacteria group bacterium]MDE2015015.1 class I SAM-dependent methyltransferase [Patescibacteria group bacterium]MDE2226443.1 class I SAM-dependent methyltransferase [Patescibacteria group bacterium]
MDSDTSFERFAKQYDEDMGDTGSYNHQHTIDPPLFDLIGDQKGLAICDIACGNGYIARKLMREGAKEVWASDISPELIKLSKEKYENLNVKFFVQEAEDFTNFPENYFDLVIIHMAIWYVEDVDKFLSNVRKILKMNGRFIYSIDHPMKWSLYKAIEAVPQEKADDENEKYLEARKVKTFNHWLSKQDDLSVYYRPMEYYMNLCGKNGLLTKSIREPSSDMIRQGKHYKSGIPMKMVIETIKVGEL